MCLAAGRYLQAERELCVNRGVMVHISGTWHEPCFGIPKLPSPRNSPEDVMEQWKCQPGLSAWLRALQKLSVLPKFWVVMRLPLPWRAFAGVGVGQSKLSMVLWVWGWREEDNSSQSATSAELECSVLAPCGRAAGRAQIPVSGGGSFPGTRLSCFWGCTGVSLNASEDGRASVVPYGRGLGPGTLFLILVRVFPLSGEEAALKAGNSGGCCGERFQAAGSLASPCPAPCSATANPLFLGMPVTKLPLLPVTSFHDPTEAEALRDSSI